MESNSPMPTFTEQHLSDRCQAVHEAIKAGRTQLVSVGVMRLLHHKPPLHLYNCPHCGSTISRRESDAKVI